MMVMGDGPPKERGRHRTKVENDMIRRREREFRHQQMWTGAQDYYKRFDKINTKYDEWTSPRYYEDNNKMLTERREKRDKEELLEKRKEKLKKLLEQDDQSYQIELMVKRSLDFTEKPSTSTSDEVPTKVLEEMNLELKRKEEEKRKREAEIKLYHQWRINNPLVRQFESKYKFKDLKLSWLDQQIEKRMQKEKEEKECKKFIKDQEERLKKEEEKEEQMKKQLEEKQMQLKECLDKQMEELKRKQLASDELRKKESEEMNRKRQLEELEEQTKEENKRRLAKENALYNIKQHKLKLKQKAIDVQEALAKDKEFILQMKRLQLEELIRDEKKKSDVRAGLEEFLSIVKEQQELEKQRQRHLDFIFDSEAKSIYEKQLEMWRKEETARKNLFRQVLDIVNKQIEENIQKNIEAQKEVIREREEMMQKIEDYSREMQKVKEEEQQRKAQRKKSIEEEIKLKNARKKQRENSKLKEIDEELARVKKEEERLHKEIMDIQMRQRPLKPSGRSRLFY